MTTDSNIAGGHKGRSIMRCGTPAAHGGYYCRDGGGTITPAPCTHATADGRDG